MKEPVVTLDQWHIFKAVVEYGSFQKAADHLLKSQSSVSYAIQKMQDSLGVNLFEQQGRRSVLTPVGKQMQQRADALLAQAASIEKLANEYSEGWEPQLNIMVTQTFPHQLINQALAEFSQRCTVTSIDLLRGSLSGVNDAALDGTADLIITNQIPTGFTGERLCHSQLTRVARKDHPLNHLGRELSRADLKPYAQIVVRDSSVHRSVDAGWLGADQRWTVGSFYESLDLVKSGLGYAVLPVNQVVSELASGEIVELQVEEQGRIDLTYFLVCVNKSTLGVAGQLFCQLLKEKCRLYNREGE